MLRRHLVERPYVLGIGEHAVGEFSAWLVTIGVIVGWLAALAGLVDFMTNPVVRAQPPAWPHFFGNVVVLILATLNMLVHSRDAYTSVVPAGVILSGLTVAIRKRKYSRNSGSDVKLHSEIAAGPLH